MSLSELFFGFTPATRAKHPECFGEANIDRRKCTRVVPMQVLSLGFARTGTASMHAALTILGYPAYHGFMMYSNISDVDMFIEGMGAKYFNRHATDDGSEVLSREWLDKVFGHVSAITDIPPICFATELIDAYPEAKVILVEREIESWFVSFKKIFVDAVANPVIPWVAWLDSGFTGKLWWVGKFGIAEGMFGSENAEEFERNARTTYRRYYAGLREKLKNQPNRVLEYRLGDGWAPLCRFLEKDVPSVEFPKINETAMMQEKIGIIVVQGVRRVASKAITAIGPFAVVAAAVGLWLANR
jgi:hypothetical protein